MRDLKKLPKQAQQKILALAKSLTNNPRPENIEPLVGFKGLYRVRTGDYRIVYQIQDAVLLVIIVVVGDRKDIYQKVERRFS